MNLDSIMRATEPLTTTEFFGLDVDEKLKMELIGGALVTRASAKPWHGLIALELRDALAAALDPAYRIHHDLDVIVDEQNVLRPDVIVVRSEPYDPDGCLEAANAVLAVEVMSPSSRVYDRRVKPALYRDAGIPSWRVERSGKRLLLVEIPVSGEEQTHLGQVILKVAGLDVPVDLDAIARHAFGE